MTIDRSGEVVDGFSTWTAIRRSGVSEVMVSGVGGDNGAVILDTIDGYVREAGGAGLKEDGVFNNAYVVAGADSEVSRERLTSFNGLFSGYYEGVVPAGRLNQ